MKPFRVLSLEGVGMRGTYTATYLVLGNGFCKKRGLQSLDIGGAFDLMLSILCRAITSQ